MFTCSQKIRPGAPNSFLPPPNKPARRSRCGSPICIGSTFRSAVSAPVLDDGNMQPGRGIRRVHRIRSCKPPVQAYRRSCRARIYATGSMRGMQRPLCSSCCMPAPVAICSTIWRPGSCGQSRISAPVCNKSALASNGVSPRTASRPTSIITRPMIAQRWLSNACEATRPSCRDTILQKRWLIICSGLVQHSIQFLAMGGAIMTGPRLADQVWIVTGAASGIGRAIARLFGSQGARIVVAEFTQQVIEGGMPTIDMIAAEGGKAVYLSTDVSEREQVDATVAETVSRYGRLDGIVNNACIRHARPLLEMEECDWERVLKVNLTGAYCGCAVDGGAVSNS